MKHICLAVILGFFSYGFSSAKQAWCANQKTLAETLGYPKDARLLIIQAEDLGMAHSIDTASFKALEQGWVTTANMIVPGPWFPEVARWASRHPRADLGLQLDLNSDWNNFRWRPVTNPTKESGLADDLGYLPTSDYYVASHAKLPDAEVELRAQIAIAKQSGIEISHLDNHMHVMQLTPPLFQLYCKLGGELGIPVTMTKSLVKLRGTPTSEVEVYSILGLRIYLSHIPVDAALEIKPGWAKKDWFVAYESALGDLPPGVYLLSVHLGFDGDELQGMMWDHPDWGAQWRQNDMDVIGSPAFQRFLKDKGFILIGWKDLKKAIPDFK